eukprot:TRINITY_DN9_c1_g1_i1.p1 TRINITY_DN9_c1_g1~~TRINITY_DN9_c1_g1_i1.p1  ORF type:complete len:1026 (-),score=360.90 TRINITY_DN9_c1_g1_i1:40-3117(-)
MMQLDVEKNASDSISNGTLESVLKRMKEGLCIISLDGNLLFSNEAVRNRFPSLFQPDSRTFVQRLEEITFDPSPFSLSLCIKQSQSRKSQETFLLNASNGETFKVELNAEGEGSDSPSFSLLFNEQHQSSDSSNESESSHSAKKRKTLDSSASSSSLDQNVAELTAFYEHGRSISCIFSNSKIIRATPSFAEYSGHSLEKLNEMDLKNALNMEELNWNALLRITKTLPANQYFSEDADIHCQGAKRNVKLIIRRLSIPSTFICTIEDLENVRNQLQDDIKRKELIAKEMLDKLGVLSNLFDAPVMMGTLDINQENSSIQFVSYNQATADFFQSKSDSSITLDAESPSTKTWMQNLSKSQLLNNPVSFEVESESKKTLCCCGVHIAGNRFSIIAQDITARKEVELKLQRLSQELENEIRKRTQQLESALEVKSRFLATMSHEMRTPLFGVMGTLNLLADLKLEPTYQEMIRIGQICGEQLLVLINDILDFSRLQENKMEIENYPFSIQQAIQDSFEVVAVEAQKKGIELVYDMFNAIPVQMIERDEDEDINRKPLGIDFPPDVATGDAARVRQVLVNLLSNAIKFCDQGQVILRVRSYPSKGTTDKKYQIEFSVEDSGIGISDEAKQYVFDPFYQGDSTSTRKHGGTGLGLPISKKLVELMGGKMIFQTVAGRGTLFTFTITTSDVQKYDLPKPNSMRSGKKGKIIISDPNEVFARSIKNLMDWWGFETVIMNSRDDVVQALLVVGEAQSSNIVSLDEYRLLIIDHKNLVLDTSQPFLDPNASTTKLTLSSFHRSCPSFTKQKIAQEEIILNLATHLNLQMLVITTPKVSIPENLRSLKKPLKVRSLYKTLCYLLGIASSDQLIRIGSKETLVIRPKSPSFLPLRILVAEDNPLNQKVIRRLLGSMGFRDCEIVGNGELALNECKKTRYDVILMDVMMPIMGGIECTEKIREQIPIDQQPIIIGLTADACDENEEACRKAGMDDFLTKPVQQAKLQKALQEVALSVVHKQNSSDDVIARTQAAWQR